MAVKEEYKEIVLNKFVQNNCREGHVITIRDLRFSVMINMTKEEQNDFIDSINSLIQDGLITYEADRPGMEVLRLTQNGYDKIYPPANKVNVAKKIMDIFKNQHIEVGQVVTFRYIDFNFFSKLNPKEQDVFEEVCNKLIAAQWIEYKNKGIECLMLLQRGYDFIYHQQGDLNFVMNG